MSNGSDPAAVLDAIERAQDAFEMVGRGRTVFEEGISADADWETQLTKACRLLEVVDTLQAQDGYYTAVIEVCFGAIERSIEAYALSIGDAGDLAQFALDAANSTLEINIDGITRTIDLETVESLRYPVEMPDIDIPATVHLSPDDISLGLDAADMLADRFDLTVDSETREVRFAADGDTDSMTYRWEDTDLIAFEPADVEVKLDSSLVKSANAGLPDGTNRVLHIGDSVPLVLKSEFPDADGAMQFVIAPKLPN
ncbi:hypothetical protein [Haloarcula sp. CBA1127]|uniref:hypothetical protein n=1 Tax=Haloarcula sp. CBA1127 TaxID=1765055 RepID=UPI00073EA10D|nr:hypothetical protein [Haloarcula sp. CBA1127]